MSARDSASPGPGSSGGLANGGIGGGFGGGSGGYGGVGAGRNGGANSRTGMQTGATMRGTTAFGRPGGPALGWGMTPAAARQAAMAAAAALTRTTAKTGVSRPSVPNVAPHVVPVSAPPPVGLAPPQPTSLGWLPGWPGTGQWWANEGPWNNDETAWPGYNGSTFKQNQPGNVRYPGGQTQLKNGSTMPAPTGKEEIRF